MPTMAPPSNPAHVKRGRDLPLGTIITFTNDLYGSKEGATYVLIERHDDFPYHTYISTSNGRVRHLGHAIPGNRERIASMIRPVVRPTGR
jgi:hypothetical protein